MVQITEAEHDRLLAAERERDAAREALREIRRVAGNHWQLTRGAGWQAVMDLVDGAAVSRPSPARVPVS